MRVLVQKVLKASVKVDNSIVGQINKGLLVFVAFTDSDNIDTIKYMAKKIINLRVFEDNNGVMNLSVNDIGGEILSVSQFTLYGDASKGNRPSYIKSLNKESAKELYNTFNKELRKSNLLIETGIFHADMKVELINDGPTTILLERE